MLDRIDFAALMEPVARRLLGEPNKKLSKPQHELRFGTHGSFCAYLQKGVWRNYETGEKGGVLDLIARQTGLQGAERFRWLEQQGLETSRRSDVPSRRREPPVSMRKGADEAEERRKLAYINQKLWPEVVLIPGTPGHQYLLKRRIDITQVPNHGGLRWHPRCPWGERNTTGCILARYSDAITGELRGLWRRPINGEKPKSLGPQKGCVIRLWPDDWVTTALVYGEGVETVLSAALNIEHRGTLLQPAWAAGCADNMTDFPVLAGVEALTLLVDNDASGGGQAAAAACARRWYAAGREVIRLTPRQIGADFNDIVREGDAA